VTAGFWVIKILATTLGDWVADSGPGYLGAAGLFGLLLLGLLALWRFTSVSRVGLFWAAFVLTRPLSAAVGDFLDKPLEKGGLDLSRPLASLVLVIAIGLPVWLLPQRAAARGMHESGVRPI
jgi:uncharacterized membrane-anchored protein